MNLFKRKKKQEPARETHSSELLKKAIEAGDLATVITFFDTPEKTEKYISCQLSTASFPLRLAAYHAKKDIILFLLGMGADVNMRSPQDGEPAISRAINEDHMDIMRLLLDKGAHIDDAIRHAIAAKKGTALMILQEEYKATTQPADILKIAAENKNMDMINDMLDAGAPVDTPLDSSSNLMIRAAAWNNMPLLGRVFLPERINAQQVSGFTALHHAFKNKNYDMAKFLIDHGARFDIQNKEGKTALDLALEAGDSYAALCTGPGIARGEESWQLLGADKVLFTGNYKTAERKICEIFNFSAQEKLTTVTDLADGKVAHFRVSFGDLADKALEDAYAAYAAAGGKIAREDALNFSGTRLVFKPKPE